MLTSSLLRPRSDSCRSRSPGNYVSSLSSLSLSSAPMSLLSSPSSSSSSFLRTLLPLPRPPSVFRLFGSLRCRHQHSPPILRIPAIVLNGGNTPRVPVTLRVKFRRPLSFAPPPVVASSLSVHVRHSYDSCSGSSSTVRPSSPPRRWPRHVERFRPLSVCPAISRLDWGHRQETPPPPFCFTHSRLYRTCRRRPPFVFVVSTSLVLAPALPSPSSPSSTCFVPSPSSAPTHVSPPSSLCRLFPFHPCLFNQVLFSIPSLQTCVCIKLALAKT